MIFLLLGGFLCHFSEVRGGIQGLVAGFPDSPLLVGGSHHPSVERNIPMSQILQIFSTILKHLKLYISEQTHNCNTEAFA